MKILVVEDYEPLRSTVVACLKEEGYAVDQVATGTDGKWFASQNDYDVVLLDIMLPGIDGLSILKSLRENNSNVFVMITSARANIEDRVRGLDLGADDYLPKPFSLEELCARIRSLIRRRYNTQSPVMTFDDLEIDTVKKRVLLSGNVLDLTAREYAILSYLASRPGHIVSRDAILDHVYNFQADVSSNIIDVYIKNLRKKLEQDGRRRLIHTKRYQGYFFQVDPT